MSPTVTVELDPLAATTLETLVGRAIALHAPLVREALGTDVSIVRVRTTLALLRDLGLVSEHFDDHSRPLYASTAAGRAALTGGQKEGADAQD